MRRRFLFHAQSARTSFLELALRVERTSRHQDTTLVLVERRLQRLVQVEPQSQLQGRRVGLALVLVELSSALVMAHTAKYLRRVVVQPARLQQWAIPRQPIRMAR